MHDSHSQVGDVPVDASVAAADAPVAIDCASCDVRGLACGDCVVTVLLGTPPSWLDDEEQRALGVLADSGLVPPLRLVTTHESEAAEIGETQSRRVSTSARREAYRARDTG